MSDSMKKAFDIVKGGDKFKTNPIAIRMKAKNDAKDLGRSLGKGHVPKAQRRDYRVGTKDEYPKKFRDAFVEAVGISNKAHPYGPDGKDFWKGMRGGSTKGHSNPGLDSTPRHK